MFGTVKIGDKEVEMTGNAATPYRFKQVFHEDYLKKVTGKEEAEPADFFAKLGFIMAMQAEKKDMSKLNEESFFRWLEAFEPSDVFSAADAIADLYAQNEETASDPK